jgi:hypothetical protein
LARLTREYDQGLCSEQKYRAFVYGLRGLLAALEQEHALDYEAQLAALTSRMEGLETAQKGRA